ncbi:hypothetical protein NL64_06175 [Pseudomonas fluorescens]|uniref:hypothetical protein n=1 Tax=Pseudomonas fluorescens TaxID=294 RepID=UPI00054B8E30|nr:hypothetical protein [Pseudomonas fluorescens]KII34847.1 hypothetical protein NL64_06175 [Pseudomonas fluorescens]
MSDSLSGLLAGLNQGVQSGLDLYKTVEGEKRARRQEDYQRERDAKADSQWDSMYSFNQDKFGEEKRQYNATLGENQRQFDVNSTQAKNELASRDRYQRGALANQAASVANDTRRINISEETYKDSKLAAQMQRTQQAVMTAMYSPDGQLRGTPEEINQRLRDSGLDKDAGKLLAYLAPERYGKGNYTDVRAVATPKGLVPLVDGHDMEGQPIKAGGAPATANGSAKDTDVTAISFDNAALALLNPHLISERQADFLAKTQTEKAATDTRGYVDSGVRAAKGTDADVAALSNELSKSEARLTELKTQREALTAGLDTQAPKEQSFGDWLTTPNASLGGAQGGVSLADQKEAQRLDKEIKSLSQGLDGPGGLHEKMRATASVKPGYQARGNAMFGAQADAIERSRSTQSGAQYLSNAAGAPAAQVKAQEASQKAWDAFEKDATGVVELPKIKNSKTGKTDMPVTKAHLTAQLRNLPPEIKARVASDPRAQAALMSTLQTMANNGQSTGLARFADAASKIDDLELYSKLVNDPAMSSGANGQVMTDDQRHQWAINAVQQRELGESSAMSLGRTMPR